MNTYDFNPSQIPQRRFTIPRLPSTQPAILIALLVTVGILTYFVGLMMVTPILGYASWHAYRETLIPESSAEQGVETGI
ncbi:putative integral membrane protein [Thiorhodovibrio winogradskyi]|uniref:Integral membrane protein n=1 Tax=Thiorhodovibrio winogradskyi TaxID=77007 RepID=A0ABZ0S8L4_9GAMM|nr:hypothetical protein [Thiorhodovibrio winogradskyi]